MLSSLLMKNILKVKLYFFVKGYVESTILPGVQKPIKVFRSMCKNECPCSLLSFIVLCVLSNSFTQEAKCPKLFLIDGSDDIALD